MTFIEGRAGWFLLVMGLAAISAAVLRGWLERRRVDRQLDERDDDWRGI